MRVLQEFRLARDVIVWCGTKSAHWIALETFAGRTLYDIIFKTDIDPTNPVNAVFAYRRSRRLRKREDSSLIALLRAFNDRRCIDLRDTVIALLGMCSDLKKPIIHADIANYSHSLFRIYMNVFKLSSEDMPLPDDATYRTALYSHVLQLYLQCCTADSLDEFWRFEAPKFREQLLPLGLKLPENGYRYWMAKASLEGYLERGGIEKTLTWLETTTSAVEDMAKDFRTWPLSFPDKLKQIVKLELFVNAVYCHWGSKPSTEIIGECTQIALDLGSSRVAVMVDNNSGEFEVVRSISGLRVS